MVPFHCQPSAGKSSETCCTQSPPKLTTKSNHFPNYHQIWCPHYLMNLIVSSTVGGVKEQIALWINIWTPKRAIIARTVSQKESTWSTREHSSRMRTIRFCGPTGRDIGPDLPYSSPEGTWDQRYPTSWKGHGNRDQEGTWLQRYPTPFGQTNTCENIAFPQTSWRW